MPLFSIRDLHVAFGHQTVLSSVSLTVSKGEIITIVGPNGSGKSTLLKAIIGCIRPTSGSILREAGLRVGYVPQKLNVDARLPLTAARFLGLPRKINLAAAKEALERVDAAHLAEAQLSQLSGGQFQRVLLARAILDKPQVLLLDEPTQGLDQPGSAAFYQMIDALRRDIGCAVLMVSHELHVVMSASDRVICLNGHICCEGAPEVVTNAPEYRALFGSRTQGALALYRHVHDHAHDHAHDHGHVHAHEDSHPDPSGV